ncbi:hypothetical protein L564_1433, partial [Bordetella pertussis CHLA-15]
RARCTHLQTQPGRIQPIDSSQLVRAVGNFEDFVARYAVVVHNPAQDRPTTV